jgi:CHRD domain-containing protein
MKRFLVLLLALAAGCAAGRGTAPPASAAPTVSLCATLAGAGPASDALDPEGRGHAVLHLEKTAIRFRIETHGVGRVTMSHIHHGASGVNGPMIWEINPGFDGDSIEGEAAGLPPGVIRLLASEPSEFYVKLHTLKFPGGAIRGQLEPCGTGSR